MKPTTANIIRAGKMGWGTARKSNLRLTRKWYADNYRKLRRTPEGRALVRELFTTQYPSRCYTA